MCSVHVHFIGRFTARDTWRHRKLEGAGLVCGSRREMECVLWSMVVARRRHLRASLPCTHDDKMVCEATANATGGWIGKRRQVKSVYGGQRPQNWWCVGLEDRLNGNDTHFSGVCVRKGLHRQKTQKVPFGRSQKKFSPRYRGCSIIGRAKLLDWGKWWAVH